MGCALLFDPSASVYITVRLIGNPGGGAKVLQLQPLNGLSMISDVVAHVLQIAIIVVLVWLARRIARRVIPTGLALGMRAPSPNGNDSTTLTPEEQARRLETLQSVLVRTTEVVVLILGALMVLADLSVPIAPVLAGAGVLGVAIGFGAQSLVRDFMAGLLILLENQYGRGDVVQIAGVSGVVEEVNLRRTVLRDANGTVHSVPNGEVRVASNMSRGWSRVNFNLRVGYEADLDQVRAVIDRVGNELAVDPEWAPLISSPPRVVQVDSFDDSGISLKIMATTKPTRQADVGSELRLRLKKAFDAEGIEFPYPHRVIIEKPAQSSSELAGVPNGNGDSLIR
jgi:small-conductance mechanosensitive channel